MQLYQLIKIDGPDTLPKEKGRYFVKDKVDGRQTIAYIPGSKFWLKYWLNNVESYFPNAPVEVDD